MRTRAQASMEFLTSYGWMIMVAALVAGALIYMGVFSPEQNLPQQCLSGYDFSCERFVLHENGTLLLDLVNKLGEPLVPLTLTCVYPDGDTQQEAVSAGRWDPGDAVTFGCYPAAGTGGFTAGERGQVEFRLEYQKAGGGFVKTLQGEVTANVVDRS